MTVLYSSDRKYNRKIVFFVFFFQIEKIARNYFIHDFSEDEANEIQDNFCVSCMKIYHKIERNIC